MTTRFRIAAYAVVSSAVLFLGNSSHTAQALVLGKAEIVEKSATGIRTPIGIKPVAKKKTPKLAAVKEKVEKLPETKAIVAEFKPPAPISHPVTDPTNSYVWGQCTWYAKNKRPDLSNNLGNANTWYFIAAAEGVAVGTEPRAGAIGATSEGYYGHVVYVESVNDDGTVNISEMNYAGGIGAVHYRTVMPGEFVYIY
ncbi:MAG: peptidoglycan DL-endopeptidase CwlO [Patescibacteria group bacterium]|nr:peptidoglycan DL-endopeptidase CwlO [Patescibacteria group bacterium]